MSKSISPCTDLDFELILEDVAVALRPYGYNTTDNRACAALFRALADYAEGEETGELPAAAEIAGNDTLH